MILFQLLPTITDAAWLWIVLVIVVCLIVYSILCHVKIKVTKIGTLTDIEVSWYD